MANINPSQLRQWQNGDVIPASDYNQERNILIEANNDTNQKANTATLNASNAVNRIAAFEQAGVPVTHNSLIKRQTYTLAEGQTILTLPTPYLPNTNRIQAYHDGKRLSIQELSNTQIRIPALQPNTQVTVEWFTEAPVIFDVQRIDDAIEVARAEFLPAVRSSLELPQGAPEGSQVLAEDEETVYRLQKGQWQAIYKAPQYVGTRLATRKAEQFTAQPDQQIFTLSRTYTRDENRIDVFVSGVKQRSGVDYLETSPSTIQFVEPLEEGLHVEVSYFTTPVAVAEDLQEVKAAADTVQSQLDTLAPLVSEADTVIGDTIAATSAATSAAQSANAAATSTKFVWQDPVDTFAQIATTYPNPQEGWAVPVRSGSKIYRRESGQWKERVDLSFDMYEILSELTDTSDVDGGMFGEVVTDTYINGGTF